VLVSEFGTTQRRASNALSLTTKVYALQAEGTGCLWGKVNILGDDMGRCGKKTLRMNMCLIGRS
jgi:hypothetical protein